MVSSTPRPHFAPGKDPVPILQEAGWAPGLVWTVAENLVPTGIRSRTVQPVAQSLYRLSYPAHPFHLYLVLNRPLTPLFISITSEQVRTFQETTPSVIFNDTAYHIQVSLYYLISGCPTRSSPGCVTRPAATFAHFSYSIKR